MDTCVSQLPIILKIVLHSLKQVQLLIKRTKIYLYECEFTGGRKRNRLEKSQEAIEQIRAQKFMNKGKAWETYDGRKSKKGNVQESKQGGQSQS